MTSRSELVTRVIQSFFKSTKVLSGKPVYKVSAGQKRPHSSAELVFNQKVVVSIPYFDTQNGLTKTQTNALGMAITRVFGPGVSVELRFVRLQYPYLDSSILAQYVALNAGNYNFLRMQKMMFNNISATVASNRVSLSSSLLPHQTMGVKVELAGRLPTQRSIPRKTVDNGHIGSFSSKGNSSRSTPLDFNQYTSKNKLNAFTIKV